MTFVGKILVIVIMAFALLFLGITGVVFTTARNWKDAKAKADEQVKKLQQENSAATAKADQLTKDLGASKDAAKASQKTLDDRIAGLEADIKRISEENTQSRTALSTAQQNARTALEEA